MENKEDLKESSDIESLTPKEFDIDEIPPPNRELHHFLEKVEMMALISLHWIKNRKIKFLIQCNKMKNMHLNTIQKGLMCSQKSKPSRLTLP